jgi:hypothetical protein
MRDELNKYELIDKYLNNQLSEKDLSAFRDSMKEDPSLVEEINSQRFVNEMAFDQGLLEVKRKLKSIDAGSGSAPSKRWIIYSTAVILITATIAGYVLKTKQIDPIKQTVTPAKTTIPAPVPKDQKLSPKKSEAIIVQTPQSDHENEAGQVQQPAITTPRHEAITSDERPAKDKSGATENNAVKESGEHHIQKQSQPGPCAFNAISMTVTTAQSCVDSPTGKITIDRNSLSGTLPYEFSLNQSNYFKDFAFYNLYAGTYHLSVKDAAGCVWNDPRDYVVEEKDCRTIEFSFIPTRGEVWKFPIDSNTNGKIEIYNRDGRLVYKSAIVNGEPDQWNGMSDDEPLPMGSYSFILQNGKVVSIGSVTIFR